MTKTQSTIETLLISELKPYESNPRTHSEDQVKQIADSIQEFGFTNPVLVNDESMIIAGHGRFLAAKKLGLNKVPCIRLSHLSEAQVKAYIIADNKLALNAGWDKELLTLELGCLRDEYGYDLKLTGFSEDELLELLLDEDLEEDGNTDDDAVPDTEEKVVTKTGDVWILGNHRLMCGDSTKKNDVDKLIAGSLCDGCWTDPPYNVNYEGKTEDRLKIQNDKMGAGDFSKFIKATYESAYAALKPGSAIYVAHADTEGLTFRSEFVGVGFKLSGCLIWVKNSMVLGRSDYQWKHEPILYGWKPGKSHRWYGGRNKTTVTESGGVLPFVILPDGRLQVNVGDSAVILSGDNMVVEEVVGSVLRHEKPTKNLEHPTMKPVSLILSMLKNSTKRGDIVLDLFGGSGSTLIACEKIGRASRLMELDPVFCDVIVRRWQNFTGKEAVRESGDRKFSAQANAK
ncbi:MAG: site-specific DNA-methyltransferase [Candidatus Margulisiibacteriota bacterium]